MMDVKILFDIPTKKGKVRIPRLARQFKNVSTNKEQFEIKINKKSFSQDAYFLSSLWYQVGNSKSTEIYIGSKPATKTQAQSLLQCCDCFIQRLNSPFPKEHCFCKSYKPGWGCKLLKWIARYDNDPACEKNWYEVGPFRDGIQYIDKDEIFEIIKKESEVKLLSFCPFFSLSKAKKLIDELPGQIDPKADTLWEIRVMFDNGFKPKPVGVQPKPIETTLPDVNLDDDNILRIPDDIDESEEPE